MTVKHLIKSVTPAPIWSLLKRVGMDIQRRRFNQRIVSHRYAGWPLTLLISDPVGAAWYDCDWEIPEMEVLARGKLRPGATVFDIGAHQCVVAASMAKSVGPDGKVVALEAMPFDAGIGKRNTELNRLENLTVINAAGAATSGTAKFSANGHIDRGDKAEIINVPSYSIDDLARIHGTPAVLYIDVEGYELEVLRGATETLRHRPDCCVEVHVGSGLEEFGGSAKEILSYFPPGDYELFISIADQNDPFHPLATLPTRRFHLVALSRSRS